MPEERISVLCLRGTGSSLQLPAAAGLGFRPKEAAPAGAASYLLINPFPFSSLGSSNSFLTDFLHEIPLYVKAL